MPELPLERVEELVEDSVFHPSPCKRHRERVLRSAVQATVRQTISRRMIAAVSATALVVVLGIIVVRAATSPARPVSEAAGPAVPSPASATTAEAGPAEAVIQPSTAGSLGEGLYRSSNPSTGQTAAHDGP
jgi:hypothetical protein